MNNAHCLPRAVTTVASALFFLHGKGDIRQRMREWLAVSVNLCYLRRRKIDVARKRCSCQIATSSILRLSRDEKSGEAGLPAILSIVLDQVRGELSSTRVCKR